MVEVSGEAEPMWCQVTRVFRESCLENGSCPAVVEDGAACGRKGIV